MPTRAGIQGGAGMAGLSRDRVHGVRTAGRRRWRRGGSPPGPPGLGNRLSWRSRTATVPIDAHLSAKVKSTAAPGRGHGDAGRVDDGHRRVGYAAPVAAVVAAEFDDGRLAVAAVAQDDVQLAGWLLPAGSGDGDHGALLQRGRRRLV